MFDERKGDQSDDSSDDEQKTVKSGSDDSSSDESSNDESSNDGRKVGKARKSVKLHLKKANKSTKNTRPISSKDETPRTKPTDLPKKRLIDQADIDTTTCLLYTSDAADE